MVWHVIDRVFHKIIGLQTFWGKMWYMNMIFFRLFVILVVAEEIYDDELEDFRCDTNQPGCKNVCFNNFSPISKERFWAFQIMFCTLPILIFHEYALSNLSGPRCDRVVQRFLEKKRNLEKQIASLTKMENNPTVLRPTSHEKSNGNRVTSQENIVLSSVKIKPSQNFLTSPEKTGLLPSSDSSIITTSSDKNNVKMEYALCGTENENFMLEPYETLKHSKDIDKRWQRRVSVMPKVLPMDELLKDCVTKGYFENLPIIIQIKIRMTYVITCLANIFMELFFVYLGYLLQCRQNPPHTNFFKCMVVPEKYLCEHGREKVALDQATLSPCAQQEEVSCWVVRPMEKQIFLYYMLGCQVFSIFFCFCDVVYSFGKIIKLRSFRADEKNC